MRKRGRLGYAGYVACLKTIAFGGGLVTWKAIAEAHNVNRVTASRYCHALNDLRIIHIAGWVATGDDNRSRIAAYALGDKPDAPHPGTAARPRKNKRAESIELVQFAAAIRAVQDEAHNGVTLSEATGMYPRAARAFLKAMHAAKLAYIAEFHDRGEAGAGYPLYAFGLNRRDAKKPAPIPQDVLTQRWNAIKRRLRADTKLMRGIVTGANGDRRTAPYRRIAETEVTA